MSEKYYFFDMGPYINDEKAYLAIGIGPLNPVDLLGTEHYDYKSDDFMPEKKENDMSSQTNTDQNPYTSKQYEAGHERRLRLNSDEDLPFWKENLGLLIVLSAMGLFLLISIIMFIIYCFKRRKIK